MDNKAAVSLLTALAQESRLAVFRLLVEQGPDGLAAGKIGEHMGIPAATLSFHLKELSHAGLVQSRQEGRFVFYSANYAAISSLLAFLTENCCAGSNCAVPPPACDSDCR
ncbi:ArsR/SmtB family transcription factor [Chitinimonas lacunae]|uniref:ArsR/SmtB family transcription factor n=1 Tax=Chitinimonas lacunae TaxID=1963018 RepID=A0ABV8MSK5_9NEIS